MKNLTIGIDVDGVLRDNLQIMVDLYNEHFNENKEVSDIKDFRTEITFPKIESETGVSSSHWFFQMHSDEIFLNAEPFEYVKEDIKRLSKFANIIIITYQKSINNKKQTLDWLEKNEIEYDGIVFIKDKTKLICDYLIDDNDWNFIGSNAKHGILIDAPYNENKKTEEILYTSNCESLMRYKNLHEFTKDFCQLYAY
jgi:5'(3')-deoxyribonucleotidase